MINLFSEISESVAAKLIFPNDIMKLIKIVIGKPNFLGKTLNINTCINIIFIFIINAVNNMFP